MVQFGIKSDEYKQFSQKSAIAKLKRYMNDIKRAVYPKSLVMVLTLTALLIWISSLVLPGFVVDSRAGVMIGSQILVNGLLFGQHNNGWSAYANLLFFYVTFQLLRGKQPRETVFVMLLCAATLPFFSGIQRDEGTDVVLPVVSWGWGVVLWLISLILVASSAMVRSAVITGTSIKVLGFGIFAILVAILVVHQRQWQAANIQEREMYLPEGVAFTNARFSGIPFDWPDGPLVSSDAVISLDIDPILFSGRDGSPQLELPKLVAFRQGEFDWYTYEDPYLYPRVKVRKVASAGTKVFLFQAKQTTEGAVIRIIDTVSKVVLYEQRFATTWRKGWNSVFFPKGTGDWWAGLSIGYDRAINRALGLYDQREPKKPRALLHPEEAHTACDVGSENVDGIDGLRMWDGRQVMVSMGFLNARVGFCSESYIGLINFNEHLQPNSNKSNPRYFVMVFDRRTLMPIASFVENVKCPEQCKDIAQQTVKGIRISDETAVVETMQQNFATQRNLPSKENYHLYYK